MFLIEDNKVTLLVRRKLSKNTKNLLMKEKGNMTFRQLSQIIASKEGKKINLPIGQINEVLKLLSKEIVENPEALIVLLKNGIKK